MEISKSLEREAVEAIKSQEGNVSGLIPVNGTPFFLSLDGKGIITHDRIPYEGQNYYIGVLDTKPK